MAKRRITQTTTQRLAQNIDKTQTGSPTSEAPNAGGVDLMQARWLQIGEFRRAKRCQLRTVASLSHLACLQHVRRNAARRAGLSATADPC